MGQAMQHVKKGERFLIVPTAPVPYSAWLYFISCIHELASYFLIIPCYLSELERISQPEKPDLRYL